MPGLPYTQRRRCKRARARPKSTNEPDAVPDSEGLRALIRDPKSVRSWPGLQMPAFPADQMTDREIDLVISYLRHMATRRGTPYSNLRIAWRRCAHQSFRAPSAEGAAGARSPKSSKSQIQWHFPARLRRTDFRRGPP